MIHFLVYPSLLMFGYGLSSQIAVLLLRNMREVDNLHCAIY